MDAREDVEVSTDGSARVQRACDACRTRKIRCDRATPCSNCRASNLSCQTTAPSQKVQRQRIHISDEYERKIDRIEDRLSGIEHLLESLSTKLANVNLSSETPDHSSQSRSSKIVRSPRSNTEASVNVPPAFEGETAFNTQSKFARDLLEQAVVSSPSIGQNSEIKAALASLQAMVNKQSQIASTSTEPRPFFNKVLTDIDPGKLERPPWEEVAEVIDKATVYPTMCFAVAFPFLKMHNMKQIFRETFDAPQEASICRRIVVYGVLYNLFTEFAWYPLLGPRIDKYKAYSLQCRTQMEIAMSSLDLFLPASYENILALVLSASYAVELCKPSLCWVMTSTAASLCQSLGYHRITSMKDDNPEERSAKIHVFWYVYAMDKTLSLRLGRASVIQDWDMSLPYPDLSKEVPGPLATFPKGITMQIYWIKVSQIQGLAYERLFSPAAFLKTPQERKQAGQELVDALTIAWTERGDASVLDFKFLGSTLREQIEIYDTPKPTASSPSKNQDPFPFINRQNLPAPLTKPVGDLSGNITDLFYHADVALHFSTMTLIYRAMGDNSSRFSRVCLDTARSALIAHRACNRQFNVEGNEDLWASYVHWSVMQAPFTPFIVLFCYAISDSSQPDLAILSDFVISLESCRTVSEGADKLYKMCHLFLQVAKLYVEAKTKEASSSSRQDTSQNEGNFFVSEDGQKLDLNGISEFDPYLSALGLVPNSAWPMTQYTPEQVGLENFSQAADGLPVGHNPVQDWFSGSRYIMNLMEEDINMPDLNI